MEEDNQNHVKVVVRTKPTSNYAQGVIALDDDKKTINIFQKKKESGGAINNQLENWYFCFDKVLHNASQEEVYQESVTDIIESVLSGMNGTIMAYGQTGSGKTFTMTGSQENYKHRGLIPRAIEHIFREVRNRTHQAINVRVSYLEIYNESIFDLLSSLPTAEESEQFKIVEDSKEVTHVKGLTQQVVTNEEEAMSYLFEGQTNRAIAPHSLNKTSTRSHCIFTVYLEIRSRVESNERVLVSKLNLVDLAGSERLKKTQSEGFILKEALHINKSLSFLEQVVMALSKNREHVPYRQTLLTNVLKDSLGGNCKTALIANIWVEANHMDETISTLRFATRMMRVTNDPTVNIQYDLPMLVKKYEQDIKALKSELSMHDALTSRGHINYDPYTDEQRHELQQTVRKFLSNEIEEIEIESLRQAKELFNQFKILVNNAEQAIEQRLKSQNLKPRSPGGNELSIDNQFNFEDGVGDLESNGFGIGLAPSHARPSSNRTKVKGPPKPKVNIPKEAENAVPVSRELTFVSPQLETKEDLKMDTNDRKERKKERKRTARRESANPEKRIEILVQEEEEPVKEEVAAEEPKPKQPPSDKSSLFENFKKTSEVNVSLVKNKAQLKEKKKIMKEFGLQINSTKKGIDDLNDKLEKAKQERLDLRMEDAEIIDGEEFELIKSLREMKGNYREAFDQFKEAKIECEYLSKLVDRCREKLVADFEVWYRDSFDHSRSEQASVSPLRESSPSSSKRVDTHNGEDVLDYQEKFDKMAIERIMKEDPESTYFYNARKNVSQSKLKGSANNANLPSIHKGRRTPFKA